MGSLFSRHPLALQTLFSELKRQASDQLSVLIGTPGSVGVREVKGRPFLYRQFYDAQGKKAAMYLGPLGDPTAESRAQALREQIAAAGALTREARLLTREGYVRADRRTCAILGALANRGLFRGGAVLVGSHAFGALLNEMGVRAAAFSTEDVDVARGGRLEIAPSDDDFARMLADSTIPLHPVPELDRRAPTTSFKSRGPDRLRVDLLVPASGEEIGTQLVPELKAHATALPFLRYVLQSPINAVVMGHEAMIPVHIPRPESFAWHKMVVSQLRAATSDKRRKDIQQASVIFAALAEDSPDSLETAFAALPRGSRVKARQGAKQALRELETTPHERAVELIRALI